MRRWLSLVPQLAHAIACVVVILIAEPILALLASPRRARGTNMSVCKMDDSPWCSPNTCADCDAARDTLDNPELTPAEKILFAAAQVLDNAGAPRTDTERDGIGINVELNLAGRILWLVEQRNDLEAAREREAREANRWAGEARDERQRADRAEGNLSALHAQLRQALEAESVAEAFELIAGLNAQVAELNRNLAFLAEQRRKADSDLAEARRVRDAFMEQRDASERRAAVSNSDLEGLQLLIRDTLIAVAREADLDVSKLTSYQMIEQLRDRGDDVEGWRIQCGTNERTIQRLTAKVKRLESAGSGVRFALASEPRAAILKADVVVDAKSGKVIKNKLGASPGRRAALRAPTSRPSRKPGTRKRA